MQGEINMKKALFILVALIGLASSAKAQLSVYADGHVGVGTASAEAPVSAFSVNGGMNGYGASVKGTALTAQTSMMSWSRL